MSYAKKYGFTPEQEKAVKDHEISLGIYDGRFETGIEKQAEAIEKEVKSKSDTTKPKKSGKPPKGGK